jgi:hypothetical protein
MLRAFREPLPQGPARVTLVLDSLGAAVSGASAAAVAIAAALAQRQAAPLRIVGRRVPQATESLDQLLAAQGLSFHANPSFDWLTLDGRGPTLGVTEGERFVTASLDDARLAVSLGQPARVVYVLYWRELPRLLGPEPARPTPAGCPSARAALVCEDTELREALDAAGRLDGRDPNLPVLALPAPPAAPDWLGVAARLLAGAESA